VEKDGKPLKIQAKKGVLLAAGGFERNLELREKYQPKPTSIQWTEGCDSNTGDTIAMGEKAGASFDLMDDAWWSPSLIDPVTRTTRIIIYEKNLPGSIIIDSRGKRFMNEAAPYNDAGKAIYRAYSPEAKTIPAYLIFDGVYRKKYPCGPMMPGRSMPDFMLPKGLEGVFFQKDKTVKGLAEKIGIDPARLVETIRRFNEYARSGKDLDFRRGETMQDCYYSVKATGPNPSLAPLEKPPFYAIKIYPGDLGTKGGVRTDHYARVLTKKDEVIGGLTTYPGAGGTIGPAMVFGFLAAEHAMGASED
jgi:3-oxosteroid 1-dehydrogenase